MRAVIIAVASMIVFAAAIETSSAQSGRDRMEQRLAMKHRMMDRAKHSGMHKGMKHRGHHGMRSRGRPDMR